MAFQAQSLYLNGDLSKAHRVVQSPEEMKAAFAEGYRVANSPKPAEPKKEKAS